MHSTLNSIFMFPLLAAADGDTAKSFIDRLPDILRAASANPLALVALITLTFAILAYFLFKNAHEKIKLSVLYTVAGCVLVLALVVIYESNITAPKSPGPKPRDPGDGRLASGGGDEPAPSVHCLVSGRVYNKDANPAAGMQAVKLFYLAASPAEAKPVHIATTSPDGHFSFNCSQIKPEAFPIHLQLAVATPAGSQLVETDDTLLLFGDNPDVNLYLSLKEVSNHYRFNKATLRISSAQLFKGNFTALTKPDTNTRVGTNSVVAIPRSVRVPSEFMKQIQMTH